MSQLIIQQLPALNDNYIYVLHDPESGETAAVDPGQAQPVHAMLARMGWRLSHILVTHHHGDHTGGIPDLVAETGAKVVGARADLPRIPNLTMAVNDGDSFLLGHSPVMVMAVPGHTSGHIAFHLPSPGAVFCGDTLFSLGCGRLFEGTAEQMWASLCRLRDLPDATLVYCAHEYTAANGRFARVTERNNPDLAQRIAQVAALTQAGKPTIPTTIAQERATNPFLRADHPALAQAVGMDAGADPAAVFAEIRRRKDVF